jgi:farnesyl diphosphate synthase
MAAKLEIDLDAFGVWLTEHAQRVEMTLEELLPEGDVAPEPLHQAMRWAVLGGGKRVRAAMVYAAGYACHPQLDPAAQQALDRAAAAVELVHAYSLIHDDLPCMDDDTMRRGKAATHVQFGEAMALLAGDAMQPLAFEWLAGMAISPALVVQAVHALASAIGSDGMAGGQAIDLLSTGETIDELALASMHAKKTGALMAASLQIGAIVVGAGSAQRNALRTYAEAIGLAFQVVDDVLDATTDSDRLGKTAGKDSASDKATYVSLMGVDRARELADELAQQAQAAAGEFGRPGERLVAMAQFVVRREF